MFLFRQFCAITSGLFTPAETPRFVVQSERRRREALAQLEQMRSGRIAAPLGVSKSSGAVASKYVLLPAPIPLSSGRLRQLKARVAIIRASQSPTCTAPLPIPSPGFGSSSQGAPTMCAATRILGWPSVVSIELANSRCSASVSAHGAVSVAAISMIREGSRTWIACTRRHAYLLVLLLGR